MAERLHYLISLSTLTIPGFCENDSILSGETKDQPLFPGRVAPLPRRHEAPQHAGGARPGPPRVPPPRRDQPVRAPLGRAGQRRALSSAGRQHRPSRYPLGPPRAPIAPTPPAQPRLRPPPPRGVPGAGRRPRRLRGSQQTPLPVPANGRAPLPEGERRPRRLTGREEERRTTNPGVQAGTARPSPAPREARPRAGSARPWVGLALPPSGLEAAAGRRSCLERAQRIT